MGTKISVVENFLVFLVGMIKNNINCRLYMREGLVFLLFHSLVTLDARCGLYNCVNDPSAGSPTETLLRLLLPLSDKVYITSRSRFEP
jgi:hypothetical protein